MARNVFEGLTGVEIREAISQKFGVSAEKDFSPDRSSPPFVSQAAIQRTLDSYNLGIVRAENVGGDAPINRAFLITQDFMTGITVGEDILGNVYKPAIDAYLDSKDISMNLPAFEGVVFSLHAIQNQMRESNLDFFHRFSRIDSEVVTDAINSSFEVEGRLIKFVDKGNLFKPEAQRFVIPPEQFHLVDGVDKVVREAGINEKFREGAASGYFTVKTLWKHLYPSK